MAHSFLNDRLMRSLPFRSGLLIGLMALALSAGSTVRAASSISTIALDPATTTITADQTQTYKVIATAADGTVSDVTSQSTLSTDNPLGKFSGAVYSPVKAGAWTVQAVYQSLTATATATVNPGAVQELVINPNSGPEQAYLGTNAKFTATVYDGHNNVISGPTVTWSVIGEIGTIDAAGTFKPKQVGTGKVQAAVGDVTGQVSVAVNASLVTNTAPVTNTAVTNTAANANTANNTNAVSNVNAANSNVNAAATTSSTTTGCTTLKPWAWTLLLVVFLLVVVVLYALVPVAKIWPAVAALAVAAILAFIQRKYACDGQLWWAWVVTLGTIAITALALQMRPKNTPTV